MTGRFWPSESVGAHWGMFPIGPVLDAWGFRIPEEAIIHGVSEVPIRHRAGDRVAQGDASTHKDEGNVTGAGTGTGSPANACESSAVDEAKLVQIIRDAQRDFFIHLGGAEDCDLASRPEAESMIAALRPYFRTTEPLSVSLEKCLKAMREARPSRVVTFQKVEQRGGDEPVITHEKVEYLITDESKAKAVLDAAEVSYVD